MKKKAALTKVISVKVSEEDYSLFKAAATNDERPLGQFIRRIVRDHIQKTMGD